MFYIGLALLFLLSMDGCNFSLKPTTTDSHNLEELLEELYFGDQDKALIIYENYQRQKNHGNIHSIDSDFVFYVHNKNLLKINKNNINYNNFSSYNVVMPFQNYEIVKRRGFYFLKRKTFSFFSFIKIFFKESIEEKWIKNLNVPLGRPLLEKKQTIPMPPDFANGRYKFVEDYDELFDPIQEFLKIDGSVASREFVRRIEASVNSCWFK